MQEKPHSPPPIICVNDRILIEYAILDEKVGFKAGHHLMFVNDKEIGRVPCLAICQDKDSPRFFLYFCDNYWAMIGMTSSDSINAAKRTAELIYPGSSASWRGAEFTEEDRERFLERTNAWTRCSFCGKRDDERLLSSTFQGKNNACICSNCVREFYSDLRQSSPG